MGRPEGKGLLARARRRRDDNIKVDLKEVSCDSRDWMGLAQGWDQLHAYVRTIMNQCSFKPN